MLTMTCSEEQQSPNDQFSKLNKLRSLQPFSYNIVANYLSLSSIAAYEVCRRLVFEGKLETVPYCACPNCYERTLHNKYGITTCQHCGEDFSSIPEQYFYQFTDSAKF